MIRTRTPRVAELSEVVAKRNHPYDVAEVIGTSIQQGNQLFSYLTGKMVTQWRQ